MSSAVLQLALRDREFDHFAMKMVQVISDAKARPIITALTRMSADRNIDHGDSSRSEATSAFSDLLPLLAASGASDVGAGWAALRAREPARRRSRRLNGGRLTTGCVGAGVCAAAPEPPSAAQARRCQRQHRQRDDHT